MKSVLKKALGIATLALASTLLLTACGSGDSKSGGSGDKGYVGISACLFLIVCVVLMFESSFVFVVCVSAVKFVFSIDMIYTSFHLACNVGCSY